MNKYLIQPLKEIRIFRLNTKTCIVKEKNILEKSRTWKQLKRGLGFSPYACSNFYSQVCVT